jgi:hypothetical protein
MEPLVVLRSVREVSVLAKPGDPETVSQQAFDATRARSPQHAELPPARRITEQLALRWREVLVTAHAPEGTHSHRLGRKQATEYSQTWLTKEYVAFAIKLVARRLNAATLTPGEYRVEREAMLRADRARWLHGRQLLLPNDDQIRGVAGGTAAGAWHAALGLAGLTANQRASDKSTQRVITRVEVMERFHDAYGEAPSLTTLMAFARGNNLATSDEHHRKWSEAYAEWVAPRRARGLPAPRVVERRGGPRGRKPRDYSREVGAARPGEQPHKRKWSDPNDCTAWIARYLAALAPGEKSTVRGYDDWARTQPGAPRASKFGQHGGWEKLRRKAQERAGE